MNFDDRLDQAARQLATGVTPQRDLWPGIEQAIRTPQRRTPWYAQAAAVILLVGASSGITYLAVTNNAGPTVSVPAELVFERAAFGGEYHLGPGFQAARNSLRAQLDAELDRLSPEAQQDIQANLDVIHGAIVQINTALEQEPDNARLQQQLLRAYREELALLRRVGGLTRNVMIRNDI